MLSHLLDLLEENDGRADLATISRSLDAHPSAVAGMLETLVHKGRLVEIHPDCGLCADCSLSSRCVLPARRIKRYQIVGKGVLRPQASR